MLAAGSPTKCLREADEEELAEYRRQPAALRLHGLAVAERPVYLDCQATTPLDPRVVERDGGRV